MNNLRSHQGFTLLEVLIAVALFAMISLAASGMLVTMIDSHDRGKISSDKLNELQMAFLVMERDFSQMTRRTVRLEGDEPLKQFIYSNESTYSSNTQGLAFVRQGWKNPGLLLPRSDVQAVTYQLEDDTLNRLHYVFVDAVVGEEPKVRPLLTGVKQVDFEFHNGLKWSSELPKDDLPLAIAIELDLEEFGLIRRQFLVPGISAIDQAQDNQND
ncbi:type II secretion system minor pseudopilin GspJ [Thalassomonas sp. M1454]|uniref:type II secretion system minor pseudopilin GspJ n=1 Tax=Thalassomonas sp. M1454 TaxID=2594477 RepID=UPI00117FDBC1|nr:type II secretion system minor pseudopilin GspJ [Thalassomonas sp. M1454]TRX57895.1 type II secretion system protein GspJ [Thalassomonas sp. M1454]